MDTIDALNQIGQHLWLDDISKEALEEGAIARYRDECSVSGITANPTIFERAVSSRSYDHEIAESVGTPEDVFWQLAVNDVRRAADQFAEIHRRTVERTGWVSIELAPSLANDPDASIAQAIELVARIDRPNVMVKVPGTEQSPPAIEELTFMGIPVNVTLLFGIDQWRVISDAYVRGLERRLAEDRSLAVASVASFFLSRIDHRLDSMLPEELRHRAAISCAAHVYDEWRTALDAPRWRRLAEAGAGPQQLLWASTSPKSEDLDETYYATKLAAPDTIITLPSQTLDALCAADGNDVKPLEDVDRDEARRTLARIEDESGTSMQEVASDLQRDGVQAFADSFDSLLESIEEVRRSIRS